jgi:hypothetical protein
MPIPKFMGRGGNRHPVPLGGFIRDILSSGGPTWGANIYRQYKEAVQAVPYTGKRGTPLKSGRRRRAGSYDYFSHYLHVCESLGLIRRIEGRTQPAVQHSAGGYDPGAPDINPDPNKPNVPNFQEAQFWELVPGMENALEWDDPWGSRYPSSRIRRK